MSLHKRTDGCERRWRGHHSPDNVHVCVSVSHVQSQQRRDVIGRRGWAHVPGDDVHPDESSCYINSHKTLVSSTRVSQLTDWESRTPVSTPHCVSQPITIDVTIHFNWDYVYYPCWRYCATNTSRLKSTYLTLVCGYTSDFIKQLIDILDPFSTFGWLSKTTEFK